VNVPLAEDARRLRAAAKVTRLLAVCVFLVALTAPVRADEYPSRPIHLIVPTAPGGAGDLLARELGDRLAAILRVPVVVENKPGGSGVLGNDSVAHSAPDGYTLLFATSATHIIAAQLIAGLAYDPIRDFTPVVNAAYATSVIVVNGALPVYDLAELVSYARARPGMLNYASSGVGSANHLDTEVFAALAGIRLMHIPYRGTADGYRALLVNEVQVMVGAITSALPYVRSGQLRALAVLADKRSPLLPDVPTIAQAGLGSVDVHKWLGLLAPAHTPAQVIDRVNGAINAILREPATRAWMEREGFEIAGGSSTEFARIMQADDRKWRDLLHRLGIRPE